MDETIKFTGNRDVDLMILTEIKDKDLANICHTNSYFRSLCRDEQFWIRKTYKRFGNFLGDVLIKENIKNFNSWKAYYINLVDNIEKMYNNYFFFTTRQSPGSIMKFIIIPDNRKDLLKIWTEMWKNSEDLADAVHSNKYEKVLKLLKKDFVNPNRSPVIGEEFVEIFLNDDRLRLDGIIIILLYTKIDKNIAELIKNKLSDLNVTNEDLKKLHTYVNENIQIVEELKMNN